MKPLKFLRYGKQDLEAAKAVIRDKWIPILLRKEKDESGRNCAFCQLYNTDMSYCLNCPIYHYTDVTECQGTPYTYWISHHRKVHKENPFLRVVECLECERIVREEIMFLREILRYVIIHLDIDRL